MSTVASRDLRNHTARVLHDVSQGNSVTVTVNGEPVAEIVPLRSRLRRTIPRHEFTERLLTAQADPSLRDDLDRLAGDTTDDLGPLT
jgi:prevent-host-death family protein